MSLSVKKLTNTDAENLNTNKNNNDDEHFDEDDEYDSNDFGDFGEEHDDDFNDDDDDLDNFYTNDPERFEYECFPIEKIDWILEKKCEKVVNCLKLDDPYDAILLLKQFKWNAQKIVDLFNKDSQNFLETYFSDNNNNNKSNTATPSSSATTEQNNQNVKSSKLDSFINIFTQESTMFKPIGTAAGHRQAVGLKLDPTSNSRQHYCNICCAVKLEMSCLDDCVHQFCLECWRLHFESLISLGNTSVFECMETKCKSVASKD